MNLSRAAKRALLSIFAVVALVVGLSFSSNTVNAAVEKTINSKGGSISFTYTTRASITNLKNMPSWLSVSSRLNSSSSVTYTITALENPNCGSRYFNLTFSGTNETYRITQYGKGHSYTVYEKTDPTCSSYGHECFKCARCESRTAGNSIPPLGHAYTIEKKPATYMATGYEKTYCKVCGYVKKTTMIAKLKCKVTFDPCNGEPATSKMMETQKPIGNLPVKSWAGHTFLGWYTEKIGGSTVTSDTTVPAKATYTIYGHWKTNTETVPSTHTHKYSWVITEPPTYTSTGVKENTCSICGSVSETRTIPKFSPSDSFIEASGYVVAVADGKPAKYVLITQDECEFELVSNGQGFVLKITANPGFNERYYEVERTYSSGESFVLRYIQKPGSQVETDMYTVEPTDEMMTTIDGGYTYPLEKLVHPGYTKVKLDIPAEYAGYYELVTPNSNKNIHFGVVRGTGEFGDPCVNLPLHEWNSKQYYYIDTQYTDYYLYIHNESNSDQTAIASIQCEKYSVCGFESDTSYVFVEEDLIGDHLHKHNKIDVFLSPNDLAWAMTMTDFYSHFSDETKTFLGFVMDEWRSIIGDAFLEYVDDSIVDKLSNMFMSREMTKKAAGFAVGLASVVLEDWFDFQKSDVHIKDWLTSRVKDRGTELHYDDESLVFTKTNGEITVYNEANPDELIPIETYLNGTDLLKLGLYFGQAATNDKVQITFCSYYFDEEGSIPYGVCFSTMPDFHVLYTLKGPEKYKGYIQAWDGWKNGEIQMRPGVLGRFISDKDYVDFCKYYTPAFSCLEEPVIEYDTRAGL